MVMDPIAPPPEHVENRHLEEPVRTVDLREEVESSWSQLPDAKAGHTAKTLLKQGKLRMVLLAVRKGASIPEHKVDGECSLHVLSGRVAIVLEGQRRELKGGQVMGIEDQIRHDVEALEDSNVLLTVSMLR